MTKQHKRSGITLNWAPQARELRRQFPELTEGDVNLSKRDEENMLLDIDRRLHQKRSKTLGLLSLIRKKLFEKALALKPVVKRKSNLLHGYYAVNSVDGLKKSLHFKKNRIVSRVKYWFARTMM